MRRKVLAWTAAALIVALISAAFLRPADSGAANPEAASAPILELSPDFGGVAAIYSMRGRRAELPITDCTGDTHILNAEAAVVVNGKAHMPYIRFSGDIDVAFTDRQFRNGEPVPIVREYDDYLGGVEGTQLYSFVAVSGLVERHVAGEGWQFCDLLHLDDSSMYADLYSPLYPVLDAGGSIRVSLPIYEYGTYRFTYFFRESINSEPRIYSTGDEMYSITHTYTYAAPEPSGKPLDVTSVSIIPIDEYYSESILAEMNTVVELTLKNHTGGNIYRDYERAWLDIYTDGGWQPAPPPDEYYYAVYRKHHGQWLHLESPVYLYIEDTSALHRLTLEYTNSDSTERYTLILYLDFSSGTTDEGTVTE